jgi:hypothetical protein
VRPLSIRSNPAHPLRGRKLRAYAKVKSKKHLEESALRPFPMSSAREAVKACLGQVPGGTLSVLEAGEGLPVTILQTTTASNPQGVAPLTELGGSILGAG